MSDLVRRAVVIDAEIVPEIAAHLARGIRLARVDGRTVSPAAREVVAALTAEARELVRSVGDPISPENPVKTRSAADLTPQSEDEIDTATAAQLLSFSESYVRRLIKRKAISGRKVGRIWLVKREDVDRFAGKINATR